MTNCLICNHNINPFINLGKMPQANGYLMPEQFTEEYFYELAIGFCENCYMVQLINLLDPSQQFNQNYAYFSSTSDLMVQHFKEFAEFIQTNYLSDNAKVIEIGSNDGIMLQHFASMGVKHLGIEPSANVAQVAIDKGLNVITEFFNETTAKTVADSFGQVDAICAANVIGHIVDINSVVKGVKHLLKPDGIFAFEHPYTLNLLQATAYDQFYDEHVYYYTAHSVKYLFAQHDLELIDVLEQPVHGGSMRYVLGHPGAHQITPRVDQQLALEEKIGANKIESYRQLASRVATSKQKLVNLLTSLKAQGKSIVGYGATAKSTTVTNFCKLTPELIDYFTDVTPAKQGKFNPGMHIPIKPHSEFTNNYPDYAVLFAWNHSEEIMAKEQAFAKAGGKWIVFVPEVRVL